MEARTTHAYVSGFISGLAQTIVGHPLDTIKVWQQSKTVFTARTGALRLSSLYAGVSYPAVTSGFLNSISFGVANNTSNMYGHMGSGLLAGAISGLATAPIDYYKIGRQTRNAGDPSLRVRKMAWGTTVGRDAIGYGAYFPVYYGLRDQGINTLMSGAVSGMISWTVSYPLDTIKTGLQSGLKINSLWAGYLPCICRAGVVNAVGWYVYEYLLGCT